MQSKYLCFLIVAANLVGCASTKNIDPVPEKKSWAQAQVDALRAQDQEDARLRVRAEEQKRLKEQHAPWLKALTRGADVCIKFEEDIRPDALDRTMTSQQLAQFKSAYGGLQPTKWMVNGSFEEQNGKINKAKVQITKITVYPPRYKGPAQSVDTITNSNMVFKVGNSVWVDGSLLLPCHQ